MGQLIVTRASIHGFLIFDWWHRRDEALKRLAAWLREGKIRFKEDVLNGIERMPEAFLRLLQGKNFWEAAREDRVEKQRMPAMNADRHRPSYNVSYSRIS